MLTLQKYLWKFLASWAQKLSPPRRPCSGFVGESEVLKISSKNISYMKCRFLYLLIRKIQSRVVTRFLPLKKALLCLFSNPNRIVKNLKVPSLEIQGHRKILWNFKNIFENQRKNYFLLL